MIKEQCFCGKYRYIEFKPPENQNIFFLSRLNDRDLYCLISEQKVYWNCQELYSLFQSSSSYSLLSIVETTLLLNGPVYCFRWYLGERYIYSKVFILQRSFAVEHTRYVLKFLKKVWIFICFNNTMCGNSKYMLLKTIEM